MLRSRLRAVFLARVVLLLAGFSPAPSRAQDDADGPKISHALRDGSGRVWGIDERPRGLYALDAHEQWARAVPAGLPESAFPECLGRRADGAVLCLWRISGRTRNDIAFCCSEHRGESARLLTPFATDEGRNSYRWQLTGDPKGGMWLTYDGNGIYRLRPDGTAEPMHTITPEECIPGSVQGSIWNPVSVFAAADGKLWFWTSHADGNSNGATIRGALIFDGTRFVQQDFLLPDGQTQSQLTLLVQKDPSHLWFARFFDGLYTLDTTTFQAERVPGQPAEARLTSRAMQNCCGAWFFIMGQVRPQGGCMLYRLMATGEWEQVIDGVDAHYVFRGQKDRVWIAEQHGDYLGSNGNGLWLIPEDGAKPRRLDWRQGFPLAGPATLIDLQNGRWLAVSARGGVSWVGSLEALSAEQDAADNPRVHVLQTQEPIKPDMRGHVWSTFVFNSPVLHEWDGEHWSEHAFPPTLGKFSVLNLLNFDQRGRVWLRSNAQKPWTIIYDPATQQWQVFDNFRQALEAQDERSGAEFAPTGNRFDLPQWGPGHQICFLTQQYEIEAFDGHTWREWSRAEVTGTRDLAFDGAPFFDRAGRLCISADRKTWECVDGKDWRPIAFEPGFADDDPVARMAERRPPPELRLPFHPESAARDNQGTWWLKARQTLFKAREGFCVPVFAPGEATPFVDEQSLHKAFVDCRNNAFLWRDNGDGGNQTLIIAPVAPLPQTVVTEGDVAAGGTDTPLPDRRILRLSTNASPLEGKLRFQWRLDGGAWTALAADDRTANVVLEALPAGPHRFEARSLDAALQMDEVPAAFSFEVRVDTAAQIANDIAQLSDADYGRRRSAVNALVAQPAAAGATLRQARQNADEDTRWWIDAALQAIDARKQAGLVKAGQEPPR